MRPIPNSPQGRIYVNERLLIEGDYDGNSAAMKVLNPGEGSDSFRMSVRSDHTVL